MAVEVGASPEERSLHGEGVGGVLPVGSSSYYPQPRHLWRVVRASKSSAFRRATPDRHSPSPLRACQKLADLLSHVAAGVGLYARDHGHGHNHRGHE